MKNNNLIPAYIDDKCITEDWLYNLLENQVIMPTSESGTRSIIGNLGDLRVMIEWTYRTNVVRFYLIDSHCDGDMEPIDYIDQLVLDLEDNNPWLHIELDVENINIEGIGTDEVLQMSFYIEQQ